MVKFFFFFSAHKRSGFELFPALYLASLNVSTHPSLARLLIRMHFFVCLVIRGAGAIGHGSYVAREHCCA